MSGPDAAEGLGADAITGPVQGERVPDSPTEPVAPAAEPTPVVGAADATWSRPAGSALPADAPVDPNPEKLVGAAFAGGLVAALFLRNVAKRRHR